MKELPLVSVLVAIYNIEKYLPQCIESILSQTYKKLEIILVDDGSKDSCSRICDEYARKDNRIRVIHKINGGQCSARNEGIINSTGQYIQFVDGDDWIAPCMIEKLVSQMHINQADFIMCNYYVSGNTDIKQRMYLKKGYYNKESIKKDIFPTMLYTGRFYEFGLLPSLWNKLYKRELIEKILALPTDISLGEDTLCICALMKEVHAFGVIDEPLYYYRENMSGITKSYRKNQVAETIRLIFYLRKLYVNDKWKRQCAYYTYFIVIANYHNEAMQCPLSELHKRYKKLKEFMDVLELKRLLRKYAIRELPFMRKIEMFLISHKSGGVLLFGLACMNWLKDRRNYLKRKVKGKSL